ncbi:hypothetical protein [Streptomyces sp. NPDC001914]|uniref:hypothetical protein n=1 Tax=Streptomyces sp. NPDC001914 TaxID=3364623 RepID=UPI0036CF57F8
MSDSAHPALATFRVYRDRDVSGISGTGVIAEGCQFSTGWVVTHWLDQPPMNEPKTDVWYHKGTGPITKVHGHGGATRIVWTSEEDQARRKLAAGIVQAFDVPPEAVGGQAEMDCLLEDLERRLKETSHSFEQDYKVMDGFGSVPGPVQLTGYTSEYVDAIAPMLEGLIARRNRLRAALGRIYSLAGSWLSAHGSSTFPVQTAGAVLLTNLDEATGTRNVVHPDQDAQVSAPQEVDDNLRAVECSAQHHGFPGDHRQCIRAGQHRGDHIDEKGFHWSDTVAVYPVTVLAPDSPSGATTAWTAPGSPRSLGDWRKSTCVPVPDQHDRASDSCSIPEHACPACGDCVHQHPAADTCGAGTGVPLHQGWLAGIEVREACPYCPGGPMFARHLLGAHIQETHARVQAVLAAGESLDERLPDPESSCHVPHEMEL